MRLLDRIIISTGIFGLFTEDFSFHYIIDWKLFYVILFLNFFLLLFRKKLVVNKNLLLILIFLLFHGVLSYLILQNPIKSLISQLMGISLSSIVYYSMLNTYGTKRLFDIYIKTALVIAVLAIPMYFLHINVSDYRLNGILSEPAHYVVIMLPAFFVLLKRKNYVSLALIFVTIIMARSSIGYLGLLLILIIPLLKVKYFIRYSIFAIISLGLLTIYVRSEWDTKFTEHKGSDLVRRIKQTVESFQAVRNGKFKTNTNLSSYALLSNSFITYKNFTNHLLGTGLGSHKYQYEKYYPLMRPPPYLITLNQSKINKDDANSFSLRLISDLGVFGLLLIVYFMVRSFKLFGKDQNSFQQASFFYLSLKLIREGHYFPPELYFFLMIFIKDFDENNSYT